MNPLRRLLTIAVAFALSAPLAVAAPDFANLQLVVDGRPRGTVSAGAMNGEPAISLTGVINALRWDMIRYKERIELAGDGRHVRLTVGSLKATEDGDAEFALHLAPFVRGAGVFVAPDDLARIVDMRATLGDTTLALSSNLLDTKNVDVTEVPAPPRPPPPPVSAGPIDAPIARANAGQVTLSLNAVGATRFYQFGLSTTAAQFKSSVFFTGSEQLGVPAGFVTVGPPEKNVTAGSILDPSAGVIVRNDIITGADAYDQRLGRDIIAGARIDGRSVVAYKTTRGDTTRSLAFYTRGAAFDQAVYRQTQTLKFSWGELQREVLAGTRGAGVGLAATTRGDTFLEGTATAVTGNLPLLPDDAPISLDVGHRFPRGVIARAGFYEARGQRLSPFASVSARTRFGSVSISRSTSTTTLSAAYESRDATLQADYGVAPGDRELFVQGAARLPFGSLQLQSATTTSDSDTSLEFRSAHAGAHLVLGVEAVSSTLMRRVGPVVGVAFDVLPVGIEIAYRPTPVGSAVRISFTGYIPHARSRPRMGTLDVAIDGAGPADPIAINVDGRQERTFRGASVSLRLEQGPHLVSIERLDRSQGSPEQHVIVLNRTPLRLPLWDEHALRGRVVLNAGVNEYPAGFTLDRLTVLMQPWGLTAAVAPDGSFAFPTQPLDPASTLELDERGLPESLMLEAPVPASADLPPVMRLVPRIGVEHVKFDSHGDAIP